MRRGEVRRLDEMLAAALVMGPVIQAAIFRTYGRLTGPLSISPTTSLAALGRRSPNNATEQ